MTLDPFSIAPHADRRESNQTSLSGVMREYEASPLFRIVTVKNHVGMQFGADHFSPTILSRPHHAFASPSILDLAAASLARLRIASKSITGPSVGSPSSSSSWISIHPQRNAFSTCLTGSLPLSLTSFRRRPSISIWNREILFPSSFQKASKRRQRSQPQNAAGCLSPSPRSLSMTRFARARVSSLEETLSRKG